MAIGYASTSVVAIGFIFGSLKGKFDTSILRKAVPFASARDEGTELSPPLALFFGCATSSSPSRPRALSTHRSVDVCTFAEAGGVDVARAGRNGPPPP